MHKKSKSIVFLALLLATLLSGCISKQEPREKVYWPPPPADPQMEWLVTYASEDDFEKTDAKIAAEKFLGKTTTYRFGKPTGVASRGDGVMYVSDMDTNQIRVIDFNQKTSEPIASESPVALPVGMVFDSKGELYVADAHRKQVLQINRRHEAVKSFGVGDFVKPTYVALDEARNRLYVSDIGRHEVLAFDLTSGEKLFVVGRPGYEVGQLYGPQGIAVDNKGRLFVAEQFNARIQVFDTEGQHLYMFGKRGDKEFDFEGPRGLAFDTDGNLYVAEARKSSLLVFTPEGEPLTYLGGRSSLHVLGFILPTSVYIDPNDRIYVGDSMSRRITIWQKLTPDYLREHPLDQESLRKIEERVRRLQDQQEN